uniref:uncharacterized protein C11orf52 n=1 Tax=Pristiophorus japonicus TaxID=55135 RepID=UPI00398E5867
MGNVLRLCTTKNKSKKIKKSKNNSTGSETRAGIGKRVQVHEDFHAYDEVALDIPVYAVVNKKKPENIHYAEVQVARKGARRSVKQIKARQKENATEYATISFTPVAKYDRKNGTLV